MALAVLGHDLLTYPEFHELMQGLEEDGSSSGIMQAWWAGEQISPSDLHRCLAIECRLQAETRRAQELVDRTLANLERLFPEQCP